MTLAIPKNSPRIGECIYCGDTAPPLRREHAVPFGLNGEWTLLEASCDRCAKATKRFEEDTMRGLFRAIRVALGMKTRRPEERPKTLALVLEKDGERTTVELLPSEFPLYLPTPILPPIRDDAAVGDPPVEMRFIHLGGPTFEEMATRYPSEFVGARISFAPSEFVRTLAKIGYCAGVYALGVSALRQSRIRQFILGEDHHVSRWVGTWTGDPMNEHSGLHSIKVRASGADVHVFVRLFGQFGAPEYHVFLGEASEEARAQDAWPFK